MADSRKRREPRHVWPISGVRVYAPTPGSRDGLWRIKYHGPHPEHGREGHWDFKRPSEAEALQLARGLDDLVAAGDAEVRPHARVNALLDSYLDHDLQPKWGEKHASTQESLVRNWIRPVIGDVLCADLAHEHMLRVLAGVRQAGRSDATWQAVARALRAIQSHGHRHGWLPRDQQPMDGITYTPRRSQAGERTLTVDAAEIPPWPEAVRQLRACLDAPYDVWLEALAWMGLRLSESLALAPGDFDWDAGTARVDRQAYTTDAREILVKAPKARQRRVVMIPPWLVEPLRALADATAAAPLTAEEKRWEWRDGAGGTHRWHSPADRPLWRGADGGYWFRDAFYSDVYRPAYRRAREAYGAEAWPLTEGRREVKWTPHSWRHVFATWAITPTGQGGLGLSPEDAAYLAGHDPEVLMRKYVGRRDGVLGRAQAAAQAAMTRFE